jgi:hypothetical protein
MKKYIIILAASLATPCLTQASITTEANGTVTAIYGSGNSDTWAVVKTYTGADGNLQLALNQHVNPNNGNLNIDFSINVDPQGLGVTLATAHYNYYLIVNGTTTYNLASYYDNSVGTASTANGAGTEPFLGLFLGTTGNATIFQNSEHIVGSTFELVVTDRSGNQIGDLSYPFAPAAVPEPSTYAAAGLMLLPLGAALLKTLRRKQFTTDKV